MSQTQTSTHADRVAGDPVGEAPTIEPEATACAPTSAADAPGEAADLRPRSALPRTEPAPGPAERIETGWPAVTVVIPNFNGRHLLQECYASLMAMDYPTDRLQVIVVDNGSTDGSVEFTRNDYPEVGVVTNRTNHGFARACNQGAEAGTGEFVAFLNNDMRVHRSWLKELVRPLLADSQIASAGSKILTWDGRSIDFAGGSMNFTGHGFQLEMFDRNVDRYTEQKDLLFACGGAMIARRDVFLDVGGFDEDYFAFFEDVDLGWRLWVLGYRVVFAPRSICFHKHHGTAARFPDYQLRVLYERNAIYSIVKNYDERLLNQVLPAALLLVAQRAAEIQGINEREYEPGAPSPRDWDRVPRLTTSHLVAMQQVIRHMPRLQEKRQRIQARRRRPDEEILPLFAKPFNPSHPGLPYARAQHTLIEALGIDRLFHKAYRRRLLIITHDPVGERMAGPAIRYWHLAQALAHEFAVTLAIPQPTLLDGGEVRLVTFKRGDESSILPLADAADAILVSGYLLEEFPVLKTINRPIVVDIYDPFALENLEFYSRDHMADQVHVHNDTLRVLNTQLRTGDFFLCASEKQRDYWLGMLAANNRVNPQTFAEDKTLRRLIDVVPFGIPQTPPQHTRRVLKGVYPGIGTNDRVILWGGGIWDWFDPLTLIEALAEIVRERDDVKLFFMGTRHPNAANPLIPQMDMQRRATKRAKELGLTGKHVFFNDWAPYEERQNYLLEADIGASLHFDHIETRYSFRTRFLDCIWAGLPILTTQGDAIAELVERHGLGRTVPPGDVAAVKRAILELLETPGLRAEVAPRFAKVARGFAWETVAEPLARFVREPRIAPDRTVEVIVSEPEPEETAAHLQEPPVPPLPPPIKPTPVHRLPARAVRLLRSGGPLRLAREVVSYVNWLRLGRIGVER